MSQESLPEKLRLCADLLLQAATEIDNLREEVRHYKRLPRQWEGLDQFPAPTLPITEIIRCEHDIPDGEWCSFCHMALRRALYGNKRFEET